MYESYPQFRNYTPICGSNTDYDRSSTVLTKKPRSWPHLRKPPFSSRPSKLIPFLSSGLQFHFASNQFTFSPSAPISNHNGKSIQCHIRNPSAIDDQASSPPSSIPQHRATPASQRKTNNASGFSPSRIPSDLRRRVWR